VSYRDEPKAPKAIERLVVTRARRGWFSLDVKGQTKELSVGQVASVNAAAEVIRLAQREK
jgi:hypothetical protein